MIQVTPQMRILVAVEPADFRKGIDGLARLCKEELKRDPFCGWVFVFRNRRATAVKVLAYDGQGFWLSHKRLSRGRFRWWPVSKTGAGKTLEAHQLHVLLSAGDPDASQAPPAWRRVPGRQLDPPGPHDRAGQERPDQATQPLHQRGVGLPTLEAFSRTTVQHRMKKTPQIEQIAMKELESLLERVKATQGEEDYRLLKKLVDSYVCLTDLVEDKQMTIKRLRQMLFGARTEKTVAVIKKTEEENEPESPQAMDDNARAPPQQAEDEPSKARSKRKGHGRNGADAYTGAEKMPCHATSPRDSTPSWPIAMPTAGASSSRWRRAFQTNAASCWRR